MAELARAKTLQSQGDFVAAHEELADLLRQTEGLWNTDEARLLLRRLESSKELSRQRKARRAARRDHEAFMAKAQTALQALRSTEIFRPGLNPLLADAGIVDLLRRRQDKDPERALAARRALESILTECSFYIARDLRRQGDYRRLQVSLQVALRIAPETGWIWWRLAGAFALDEKPEDALDALKTAVERGFNRADLAREDPDLASLREDPRFQEIIESIGSH